MRGNIKKPILGLCSALIASGKPFGGPYDRSMAWYRIGGVSKSPSLAGDTSEVGTMCIISRLFGLYRTFLGTASGEEGLCAQSNAS